MKLNLALYSILWLLITSPVHAQTCIPQWCSAPWPPASGEHITAGLDNCKETCAKTGSSTGYKVIHGKEGNSYFETVDADIIVISQAYMVFNKAGQQVAWFDRAYVRGWKTN